MTARATAQPVARRLAHAAAHTTPRATGRPFALAPGGDGGTGWQTSSHSNAEGGNCVEVAHGARGGGVGVVPVRDSKLPRGPALYFEPGAWLSFVEALKERNRSPELRELTAIGHTDTSVPSDCLSFDGVQGWTRSKSPRGSGG